jgi:antitoxin Phd
MGCWQVQDAKSRSSEFLNATIEKGPQVVTRRGIETVVLVLSSSGAGYSKLRVPA